MEQGDVMVPFRFDQTTNFRLIVYLCINGSEPLPFELDTGFAGPLIIYDTPLNRRRLSLVRDRTGEEEWVSVADVSIYGYGRKFSLTSHPFEAMVAGGGSGIASVGRAPWLAGLAGTGLFSSYILHLDFDKKLVYLTTALKSAPSSDVIGSYSLSESIDEEGTFWVSQIVLRGVQANFVVDTGSLESAFKLSFLRRLEPVVLSYVVVTSAQGVLLSRVVMVPRLESNGIQVHDVAAAALPDHRDWIGLDDTSGVLGLQLLSRFNLTFDFPNKRLLLRRRIKRATLILRGWSGVMLDKVDNRFVVRNVEPGSPAHKAGLRSGEWIESINGVRVNGMSTLDAQTILEGFANTKAFLIVNDSKRRRTISFVRKRVVQPRIHDDHGLVVGVRLGETYVVADVLPASPALKAGIQPGDTIIAINGRETSATSLNDIRETLLQLMRVRQPFVLKVQRNDVVLRIRVPPM